MEELCKFPINCFSFLIHVLLTQRRSVFMGFFKKYFFFFAFIALFGPVISAQTELEQGWKLATQGEVEKAEKLFIRALDGPEKFRANLALSFLYEFNQQTKEAWKYYYNALKLTDDYPVYLFATKSSSRAIMSFDMEPSVLSLFK